jgi:hypothetical protein
MHGEQAVVPPMFTDNSQYYLVVGSNPKTLNFSLLKKR